jgi:hypothetical protein
MSAASASTRDPIAYAIPEKALRRWVAERLRSERDADGATIYSFALSGSTCTNVPLDVVMMVRVNAQGKIEGAWSIPAKADVGCDAMCAAQGNSGPLSGDAGRCDEAVGLSLEEAAFRRWQEEPSGCFCSAGHRRHKWRNVFQALHYAVIYAPT